MHGLFFGALTRQDAPHLPGKAGIITPGVQQCCDSPFRLGEELPPFLLTAISQECHSQSGLRKVPRWDAASKGKRKGLPGVAFRLFPIPSE